MIAAIVILSLLVVGVLYRMYRALKESAYRE